jgi:hypothetical protein
MCAEWIKPPTNRVFGNGVADIHAGPDAGSLDDDVAYVRGETHWDRYIGRSIYSAGYLPKQIGTLHYGYGGLPAESAVIPDATMGSQWELSAVERFDKVYQETTGRNDSLELRYTGDGNVPPKEDSSAPASPVELLLGGIDQIKGALKLSPEIKFWEGYCDQWASAALSPTLAGKLDEVLYYKGHVFSVAELRGLATYLVGLSGGTPKGLFDGDITALDLHKLAGQMLEPGGPGFVGNIGGGPNSEVGVWNQPFVAAAQHIVALDEKESAAVAKERFGLEEVGDRKVYLVDTAFLFGSEDEEEGDNYEGPEQTEMSESFYYLITDANGMVTDADFVIPEDKLFVSAWVPEALEVPADSVQGRQRAFFEQMLTEGVPHDVVAVFEEWLKMFAHLQPVSPEQRELFKKEFAGQHIANAYPEGELDKFLAPLGLSAKDFA